SGLCIGDRAGAARREAGELLSALAERGGPGTGSATHEWWGVLLRLSYADAAGAGSGAGTGTGAAGAAAAGAYAEHRGEVLRAVQAGTWWSHEALRSLEALFDRGVVLGRAAGAGPLAHALTDRAGFLAAANRYPQALADFRAALDLMA
ncbi:hypothetical protein GPJ59_02700, partial [Streptomyces bambusae]|nr:hypothetical protein [Streptomyces bambusae]